jgi:hypothetical protein
VNLFRSRLFGGRLFGGAFFHGYVTDQPVRWRALVVRNGDLWQLEASQLGQGWAPYSWAGTPVIWDGARLRTLSGNEQLEI